jgi:quinol monooxygenase YgiN
MSVVVVVTAFPIPEHRAEVVAAFEAAIARVHDEPGVDLYALHEGPDWLVMIEKHASEQARSEHAKGAALADLRSALQGKLSSSPRWPLRRLGTTATVFGRAARGVPHTTLKEARGTRSTGTQMPTVPVAALGERLRLGGRPDGLQDHVRHGTGIGDHG